MQKSFEEALDELIAQYLNTDEDIMSALELALMKFKEDAY